jgi:hypothetical protein
LDLTDLKVAVRLNKMKNEVLLHIAKDDKTFMDEYHLVINKKSNLPKRLRSFLKECIELSEKDSDKVELINHKTNKENGEAKVETKTN